LPDQVAAWLHRVVKNAAISAGRSRRRRQKREARVSSGEAWFSSVDDQLDAQSATRMLCELELDCREVLIARLWGGLTFDQIARLQGCSLTTAHRRYQDGLARLHERLERPCSIPTKTA
jgi:RNA polymerase sigma-70 factor (ECF subfamily)